MAKWAIDDRFQLNCGFKRKKQDVRNSLYIRYLLVMWFANDRHSWKALAYRLTRDQKLMFTVSHALFNVSSPPISRNYAKVDTNQCMTNGSYDLYIHVQ